MLKEIKGSLMEYLVAIALAVFIASLMFVVYKSFKH